jgi:hypothetical protein
MQNDVTVQMNWFERHLNWTALGMGVGSVALFYLIIFIAFGFNFVYPFDLGNYGSLFFTLVAIGWWLLTFLGYGWINFKKRQSRLYLLFLLPLLLTIIGFLIRELFFSPDILSADLNYRLIIQMGLDKPPWVRNLLIMANAIVFLVAWGRLIFFGNKTQHRDALNQDNRSFLYIRIFSNRSKFRAIILSTFAYTIVITIASLIFFNYGHLTLRSSDLQISGAPAFSLDYPAHSNKPYYLYHQPKIGGALPIAGEIRWWTDIAGHFWWLSISYSLPSGNETLGSIFEDFEQNILWNVQPNTYLESNTLYIDRIPAHQLVISDSSGPNWEGYTNYVYFFDSTYFWVIQYDSFRKFDPMPDDLKCIIDSFKIASDSPPPYSQ